MSPVGWRPARAKLASLPWGRGGKRGRTERVRKRENEAGETGQEKAENRGEGKKRQERRGGKDRREKRDEREKGRHTDFGGNLPAIKSPL